jgi:hypothetical protein
LSVRIVVGITFGFLNSISIAAREKLISASPSGEQEVPPTDSQSTGTAEFTVLGDDVGYRVMASDD